MSKLILPGLIDPHVHLRDPGQTNKEDFYTGTCAALSGGFTAILDMPNNKLPIISSEKLNEKIEIAKRKIVCDVGFYFGSMGNNLKEFGKVREKVFGLKLYLNQTTGNFLINKHLLKTILTAWQKASNTPSLDSAGVQNNISILVHAEDEMLGIVIELMKKFGNKVHVCHISTASDLEQIIKAKEKGLKITCGVTPHHLFLTENDVKPLGPFGLMKPSLKSKKDQDFLWKNLKFIDVIESDHAPHTIEEKMGADERSDGAPLLDTRKEVSPFGVPGLETTLPLLLTAVSDKRLTIDDIVRLCYTSPARIFGIDRFNDLNHQSRIEIDLSQEYTIENRKLFTKCKWSPFNNWRVEGKIERVFIRGKKVFENGKILARPGFGRIIKSRQKEDQQSAPKIVKLRQSSLLLI